MEERKNNTGLVVLVTVLVMLVLGMGGFIVYDKVINKTNEPSTGENNKVDNGEEGKEEVKEISINDSLITSLVYPSHNRSNYSNASWEYKDITIEQLGRLNMMRSAVNGLEPINNNWELSISEYSSAQIEKNFEKIFGPDTTYKNEDIIGADTCEISKYNAQNDTYEAPTGCGGDMAGYWQYVTKLYKAEQEGDYIYTYFYVQPYFVFEGAFLFDRETKQIVFDDNNKVTNSVKEIDYENRESIIESMIDKGEVDTYKWTFKKQSDRKYYFYSGAWEN